MSLGLSAGAIGLISAGASVAAPLIGGMMAGDSAGAAYAGQAAGAGQANATLQANYDQTRNDFSGYMGTGGAANNALAYALGIGGTAPGAPGADSTPISDGQYDYRQGGTTGWQANINGAWTDLNPATTDFGWLNGQSEAKKSADSARSAAAAEARKNDPNYGMLTRQFDAAALEKDLPYQNGLQWGLAEGTKGINNMAAASGSQLSGATLKALTRFGNDYATTKTAGASDRYTQRQNQIYGMFSGTSDSGQRAAQTVSQAGQATANGVAANQTSLGNARGASEIAQGNAFSGALSGAVSGYQNNKLLDAFTKRGSSGGGYVSSEPYPGYNASIGFK